MNQNTLTEQLLFLKKTTSRNTVAWKDKTRQQGETKDELTQLRRDVEEAKPSYIHKEIKLEGK